MSLLFSSARRMASLSESVSVLSLVTPRRVRAGSGGTGRGVADGKSGLGQLLRACRRRRCRIVLVVGGVVRSQASAASRSACRAYLWSAHAVAGHGRARRSLRVGALTFPEARSGRSVRDAPAAGRAELLCAGRARRIALRGVGGRARRRLSAFGPA